MLTTQTNTKFCTSTVPHRRSREQRISQTILLDRSISGNLAQKIPEAITTIRGKQQMRRILKKMAKRISMIDKEITASNARKSGMSSSTSTHFSKQYINHCQANKAFGSLRSSIFCNENQLSPIIRRRLC